jgi:hypothetical protein
MPGLHCPRENLVLFSWSAFLRSTATPSTTAAHFTVISTAPSALATQNHHWQGFDQRASDKDLPRAMVRKTTRCSNGRHLVRSALADRQRMFGSNPTCFAAEWSVYVSSTKVSCWKSINCRTLITFLWMSSHVDAFRYSHDPTANHSTSARKDS